MTRFRSFAHFCLAALLFGAFLAVPESALAFAGKIAIDVGGVTRTALIVQHERLKKAPRPLVIVLHGGRGYGARIRHNLGLEDIVRSSGPVMVYPNALGGTWNVALGVAERHDSAFIRDLIDKLVADGIADRHKVFIVGSSSGGLMALQLVCEHSALFTGAAILIASLPTDLAGSCHLTHPLRFLMIAGTADPFVPYGGGKADLIDNQSPLLPVEQTAGLFAKAAHCGSGKTVTEFPHRDPKNPTRAYLERYIGCKAPIELIRIDAGGHTIPGRWKGGERGRMVGPYNSDFDSAALIWELFHKARS